MCVFPHRVSCVSLQSLPVFLSMCALESVNCMSCLLLHSLTLHSPLFVYLSSVYSFMHPSVALALPSICSSNCPVELGLKDYQKRSQVQTFLWTGDFCFTPHDFFPTFSCFLGARVFVASPATGKAPAKSRLLFYCTFI